MKLLKMITAGAIMCFLSTALWAQSAAQMDRSTPMPAPEGIQDAGPMDPAMMQNMMQMRHHRMQQRAQGERPMWGGGCQNMMDPARCRRMMEMRQQKKMGMRQGGMMNPEMMQMRQQHMQTMEQRLSNIEKLLTELVELQKKK